MFIKPQDTLILIKYWSLNISNDTASVREISEALNISMGEISKGAKRLTSSRLLVERNKQYFAETGAMQDWLSYGIRYAYHAEEIGYGRGMASAWNCPLLESEMLAPSPPFIWAMPNGDVEGIKIKPFHDSAPFAASRNNNIYRVLALVEVIRMGKPRELKIARELLQKIIKGTL